MTALHSRSSSAGIEAALCRSALLHQVGFSNSEHATLTARDCGIYMQMSPKEMIRGFAEACGYDPCAFPESVVVGAALGIQQVGRSMVGMGDFSTNVLQPVVTELAASGYAATPQTFKVWTQQSDFDNFKQTDVNVVYDPTFQTVQEGGEYRFSSPGDAREPRKPTTEGVIFRISRQAILSEPWADQVVRVRQWGASAANRESDLVYGVLTSNPVMADSNPLFSAAHGNLGTSGAISDTTFTEAAQKFGSQTDAAGNRLNITPRYLIVGSANQQVASKIITATAGVRGGLELVVEPRIIGNQWFLVADPASGLNTIQWGRLKGQQAVDIVRADGFTTDSVAWKARFDFAATAIDWRGLFMNPGP